MARRRGGAVGVRVLFIDHTIPHLMADGDYPVGGWAVELRAWLAGLKAQGCATAILTRRDAPAAGEDAGETQFLRCYEGRGRVPGWRYATRVLPRMVAMARGFRPDVLVQACAGTDTGLMCALAAGLGVPFVYRCANDIDVDARLAQRLEPAARTIYGWGLAGAAAVLAQNGYQAGAIARRFERKPVLRIANPCQIGPAPPPGPRAGLAWLGVFQPQKDLPRLARIAAALPDVPMTVGGRTQVGLNDAPTLAALDTLAAMPNVRMAGYVRRSAVPGLLAGARALLNTSHYEGFSNTFLESWAAGTPVIAPAAADPDGLIASCGLGMAVADDAAMIAAVRAALAMPDADLAAWGERCRAHVLGAHDPAALAGELVAFLRGVGVGG